VIAVPLIERHFGLPRWKVREGVGGAGRFATFPVTASQRHPDRPDKCRLMTGAGDAVPDSRTRGFPTLLNVPGKKEIIDR
jgi:hypothetical protein